MSPAARFAGIIVSTVLIAVHSSDAAGAQDNNNSKKVFRAGVAVVDITPRKFPMSMTGGFTDRLATQAHDPLNARCLALDDGTTRLALVVCDLCLVPQDIFDAAKRRAAQLTGLRMDHMLMSATHTHTAVTVVDLARCHADPAYNDFLVERIAQAVNDAVKAMEPASIGWDIEPVPGEVSNRRWHVRAGAIPPDPFGRQTDRVRTNPPVESPDLIEPAGPTDPDVSVIAVRDAVGQPLAVFANYALHYVGNIPRDALSADYFGEFARQIGERLRNERGRTCVGILSNAASGDVNNINFRKKSPAQPPFEQVKHVAGRVVEASVVAYRRMKFHSHVTLAAVQRDLLLGVRKPSDDDLARANATLAATDNAAANIVRDVYAAETLELAKFPDRLPVKLQAMRIGELGIVALPCEPFCQIGLDIKRVSPLRRTLIVGLANAYHGYLPTPEQHALGGYETWPCRWSYLEVNASRKITEASVELLRQIQPQ